MVFESIKEYEAWKKKQEVKDTPPPKTVTSTPKKMSDYKK